MDPPKKPLTPYFLFVKEYRTLHAQEVSGTAVEINKVLGDKWNALSEEEKNRYIAMSRASKEKYAEEMEQYRRDNPEMEAILPSVDDKGVEVSLPIGTVNRIIRKDSEVKVVSKEGVFMIARATDMFLKLLARKVANVTKNNRKMIRQVDIEYCTAQHAELHFLHLALFSQPPEEESTIKRTLSNDELIPTKIRKLE